MSSLDEKDMMYVSNSIDELEHDLNKLRSPMDNFAIRNTRYILFIMRWIMKQEFDGSRKDR